MSTSSLPVETWLAICNFATYTPEVLPPSIYSRIDWFSHLRVRRLEELNHSLTVKRAIVSVCRQWRILFTPLLYECILLRKSSRIPLLLDSLSMYQRTGECSLESFVKRLDIFLVETISSKVQEHMVILPALLRLLPNLIVLDICLSDLPQHLWAKDVIIDACPQSLQVFQWKADLGKFPLFKLIRRCPKLRLLSLLLPFPDRSPEEYQESTSVLLMESLTVLNVVASDEWVDCFEGMVLPSLRGVHLADVTTLDSRRFLTVHGKQLTHLNLTHEFKREMLDLVGDLCPHLQSLEFNFFWTLHSAVRFGSQPLDLPPVKELWLHYLTYSSRRVDFELFFLKQLVSADQPHLEAVRLRPLSKDEFAHLGGEHLQLLADCRARVSVYLLDSNGSQLSL